MAIQNWEHDFNIGSIVRTANAFNVAGVHIVGEAALEPAWGDGDGSVSDGHTPSQCFGPRCLGRRRGTSRAGVDNLPGSVPLETAELSSPCCLVFGSEGPGLD